MKFKFNKKMVSTIVILIFGVAITVAVLPAKNIALENKTSSEIATEAVSATEMILDTENTETGNVDKNSSDSSKDKATVVDDKDKSGDTKSSSEMTDNNDSRDPYETDIMKNDESEDTSDDVNKTGDKVDKKSETNNSGDSGSGTGDSDNDNSGTSDNNEQKSDNGVIELPIIPILWSGSSRRTYPSDRPKPAKPRCCR